MHTQPTPLLKSLLTFLFLLNLLNSAHACSPSPGEKPASIAKKAQESRYVFEGTVTEITDLYIKIKVEQYFKGEGFSEVKIAQNQDQQNSCSDHFTVDQRGLFFTSGTINELLEPVYDGAFGSMRDMDTESFNEITAATKCMGTYEDGSLTAPCINHREAQKFYQASLARINSTNALEFSLIHVDSINVEGFNNNSTPSKCMASYKNGTLTVPCIAHLGSQKVFLADLKPGNAIGSLNFSVSHLTTISNTLHITDFDKEKSGTIPDDWEQGITGDGISDWTLEKDNTAPSSPLVLTQSGNGEFPWCIKKDSNLTDGFVTTKFKAISGSIDQAAGLIWRWKDAHNYYVARANALEDNISIYYMQDGERYTIRYVDLPSDQPVEQNKWQTLRVDFQGTHFIVSFEGKTIIDVRHNRIKGGGAVGLWTKEDSVTSFDDFSYGN